jgi:hypothetical protein
MAARDVERAHRRIREKVARPEGGSWRYDDLDVRPLCPRLLPYPATATAAVYPVALHGRAPSLPRRAHICSRCAVYERR